MKPRLIVFDLDGTLLDTLSDIRCAVNYALDTVSLPPVDRESMRRFVGNGLRNALRLSVGKGGGNLSEEAFQGVYCAMTAYYQAHPVVHSRPYEGIPELLSLLADSGYAIGVLSNKRDDLVKEICSKCFADVSFSFVLGQCKEYPLKPDPTSLLAMMEKCGVERRETLYVGDSEVDYRLSQNAGVRSLVVNYGFRKEEELEERGILGSLDSVESLKEAIFSI